MPEHPAPFSLATVAVVQFDPQCGVEHSAANRDRARQRVQQAIDQGATLVVLPELCTTGYSFHSRAEAFSLAENVPDGPSSRYWAGIAQNAGIHLAVGIAEREGEHLYNTAVLFGPEGFIGRYRKTHLWCREKLCFTAGNLGYPVFETAIGRIGLMVCWDVWFPEVPRLLALQGADIILSLNCWVWTPPPLFDESGRCMASYLTMAAAHVNNVFIAAANRTGEDRGDRFLGCSLIVGANGWPLAPVAPAEGDAIVLAQVDLAMARSAPIWNPLNDLCRDRRSDLYDRMLGYQLHPMLPR